MNLVSLVSTNSSTEQSPIASKSPGILKTPCRTDWSSTGRPGAREIDQDAATRSQAWQKDAVLDESTERLVATEEDQEHLNFSEDSKSTRNFVASRNSETEDEDEIWPHNLHVSKDGVPHMEKVFSIVLQRYGLKMKDLDVNAAI